MPSTLFDIELRSECSSFIPSEAFIIYFLGIIPFSGLEIVGLILAFIGLVLAYIIIAVVPVLKWIYLTVMWLLTWGLLTGILGALGKFIMQTEEVGLTLSLVSILVGAIGAFLFGLIRGASFRYYTESFF